MVCLFFVFTNLEGEKIQCSSVSQPLAHWCNKASCFRKLFNFTLVVLVSFCVHVMNSYHVQIYSKIKCSSLFVGFQSAKLKKNQRFRQTKTKPIEWWCRFQENIPTLVADAINMFNWQSCSVFPHEREAARRNTGSRRMVLLIRISIKARCVFKCLCAGN